jgi:PKD repeat protein
MKIFSNPRFYKPQKRYLAIIIFSAIVFFSGIILLTSCCFNPSDIAKITSTEKVLKIDSIENILKGANSSSWIKDGNGKTLWQPSSVMDINTSQSISQNDSQGGLTDKYFEIGKPIYFKATGKLADIIIAEDSSQDSSQDSSKENVLTFTWDLGNGQTLEGKELNYTFNEPGVYTVKLKASAGSASNEAIATIWVVEYIENLIILEEHNCTVEIEYILQNNGPENLKDVTCGVDIPTVIEPFQKVNSIFSELKDYKEKNDKIDNTFYKFYLGKINNGSSKSIKMLYDVTMAEFDLKDDITNPQVYDKDIYEKELKQYTKSSKYIDSDNEAIKETVKQVVGAETMPYKVAEKLYNYVVQKLEYDYEKLAQINSGKFGETNKASEILNLDKGVCEDYSILYAALCRAAGIPAKYVSGVPIRSIAYEESKELANGHAWNEINLPGLGWIPIDTTAEVEFMSENNSLNLKTYYDVRPKDYGFYYYFDNAEPQCATNYLYRVKGIEVSDFTAITNQEYFKMLDEQTNKK